MINIEKVKEFEEYRGFYDGFYIQKVKNKTNLTSDDEWHLMGQLLQDLQLLKKGLLSKEYSECLENSLKNNFANQESIDYFQDLANKKS